MLPSIPEMYLKVVNFQQEWVAGFTGTGGSFRRNGWQVCSGIYSHLDDLIIVTCLVSVAIWLIPKGQIEKLKKKA